MVDSGLKEPVSLSLGLIHPSTQARNSRGGEGIRSHHALQLMPAGPPATGQTGTCAASLPTPDAGSRGQSSSGCRSPSSGPPSTRPGTNPARSTTCSMARLRGVLPLRALMPKPRDQAVFHHRALPTPLLALPEAASRAAAPRWPVDSVRLRYLPAHPEDFHLRVAHAPWSV